MQFADFIAPVDPATFHAEYYGRRPLHIRRGRAAGPDIFNWKRFNDILAISSYWNEDTLTLYFNNRAALRESYCDTSAAVGRKAPVSSDKVKALIGLGASVVANHVNNVSSHLRAATWMLEQEFAARSFANIYCSFQGVQAFQTHFDLHDVFAFQAEGEKTWRIYEARAEAPVQPVPPGDEGEKWLVQTRGNLLFEAHMKPGDVLYLPRGQYHDALTGAAASLHVTFGVSPPTGIALFKLLEDALAHEKDFREYLPNSRDEEKLRQHLRRLAKRINEIAMSQSFLTDVRDHQRKLAKGPPADYRLPTQTTIGLVAVVKRA